MFGMMVKMLIQGLFAYLTTLIKTSGDMENLFLSHDCQMIMITILDLKKNLSAIFDELF